MTYALILCVVMFVLGPAKPGLANNPADLSHCPTPFLRGDANQDSRVDLSDAVTILSYLFADGQPPSCFDRADVNDDNALNLTDPVYLLNFLFKSGPPPPFPFDSVETVVHTPWECSGPSPCYFEYQGKILALAVTQFNQSNENQQNCQGYCQDSWSVEASDANTHEKFASYEMAVYYSQQTMTMDLTYRRLKSFNGNLIIPDTRWVKLFNTFYDGTTILKITPQIAMALAAPMVVGTWPNSNNSVLPLAGGGGGEEGRSIDPPDGCSGSKYGGTMDGLGPFPYPDTDCIIGCCIDHDWGYRTGGPKACQDEYDDLLFQCVEDCHNGSSWEYVKYVLGWPWRTVVGFTFSLFHDGYHEDNDGCVCMLDRAAAAGMGETLTGGVVTKDCPADKTCTTAQCEVRWTFTSQSTGIRTETVKYDCATMTPDCK